MKVIMSLLSFSTEFCQLICSCLQREPTQRLDLAKIIFHEWIKVLNYKYFEEILPSKKYKNIVAKYFFLIKMF